MAKDNKGRNLSTEEFRGKVEEILRCIDPAESHPIKKIQEELRMGKDGIKATREEIIDAGFKTFILKSR